MHYDAVTGFVPVRPGVTESQLKAAPSPHASTESAAEERLLTLAANKPLSLADVKLSQISLKLAASAGYGSLFDGNINAEKNFYLIEFLATTPPIPDDSSIDGVEYVLGAGVRVALVTSRYEGSIATNLGMIAASAEMGFGDHNLDVEVEGVPNDIKVDFLNEFNVTKFDLEAVRKFGRAVARLAEGMIKEAEKPDPQFNLKKWRMRKSPSAADYMKVRAASIGFALNRIASKEESYHDAITALREYIDDEEDSYPYALVNETLVKSVYQGIVDGDEYKDPDENEIRKADAIWTFGER